MKKAISVLMAALMAVTLAGCGSGGNGAASTQASSPEQTQESGQTTSAKADQAASDDPITISVAYMPNYGSLWSVMTAKEMGYFEDQGIKVKLVEFADGPTIIAAMNSGSIDVGYIGQGAHKLCIEGQAKIIALSHISDADAVIGGPGITSLQDLKGKKVAYSSGTSSEDILVNGLQKAGLTMNDIKAVDMDASGIVTAMISGGVDACATWSPNSLKILDEVKGSTKLCDNLMFSDSSISLASWIVTPKYAEDNQDKILRFTKALFKGMDYAANDHYDQVAKWVAAQTATDYDSVYAQRGDAKWLTGKEVSQGAKDGTVENYYKTQQLGLLHSGVIKKEVPVTDYVLLDNMANADE